MGIRPDLSGLRGRPPTFPRRHRTVVSAAASIAVAAALAVAAGPAEAGTAPNGTAPAGAAIQALPATTQTITLITGEKVTVTTNGGRTTYSLAGQPGQVQDLDNYTAADGDHYVIPAEAVPYLNRQLSPALFDVTALSKAGLAAGARTDVTLGFAAGTTPTAPPGVTLTSVSGQSAQGYLTAASGPAFAAGLRAIIGADSKTGAEPGASPLFGGLTSIAPTTAGGLSPFAAPAAVSPAYKMEILQINTVDLTGALTDDSTLYLTNTDSGSKESALVFPAGGVARIAVPVGHYAMMGFFDDFDANGDVTAVRLVAMDDFTVTAASTTTSVTLDERTSVNPVSFAVPRPAVQAFLQTYWLRTDAQGQINSFSVSTVGQGSPEYTNSQPKAKIGSVQLVQEWAGLGTAPGAAYRYDIAFSADKVPAKEAFVAKPGQLATVRQDFYTDPASSTGGPLLISAMVAGGLAFLYTDGTNYAGPVTDYMGTAAGGQWVQMYGDPAFFGIGSDVVTVTAGQSYSIDWAHGPLAPNVGNHVGPSEGPCLACAGGGNMTVNFNLAGDSEPNHDVLGGPTPTYTVSVNGTPVAGVGGAGTDGAELTGLSTTAPSVIREVLDTDSTGQPGNSQSLTTHTDLSFTYTPGLTTGNTLPSEVICDWSGQVTAPCQILPVLNLGYQLATNVQNTSLPGAQVLNLTVNHLSYDGVGSQAPITSATVSVSFDDGAIWQPAAVTGANGSYVATWTNPASAAGTSPELKVTATDAAGGSISQTVTAAYTIAGPAS